MTAAGAVLDAVALIGAVLRRGPSTQERMTLRAGAFALRRIADFFNVPYDHDPSPEGPISVRRDEFDAVYDRLQREGLDVWADPEQAWADFVAARVQYDEVLLALASLTMAPDAPWSSDRALQRHDAAEVLAGAEHRGGELRERHRVLAQASMRPRTHPRVADPDLAGGHRLGRWSAGAGRPEQCAAAAGRGGGRLAAE